MEGPYLLQLCLQRGYAPRVPEPFRHRIRVRFNECDGQGVVFYANYLMYFDVAMTELWREVVRQRLRGGWGRQRHRRDGLRRRTSATERPPASTTCLTWWRRVTHIGTTSTVNPG